MSLMSVSVYTVSVLDTPCAKGVLLGLVCMEDRAL